MRENASSGGISSEDRDVVVTRRISSTRSERHRDNRSKPKRIVVGNGSAVRTPEGPRVGGTDHVLM
jgi:hypothetical protein